jgi:hypothetical protein
MLVALGDLGDKACSFSFDERGQLQLIFSDHSVILDGKRGISVSAGPGPTRLSEAENWMKEHCPGN